MVKAILSILVHFTKTFFGPVSCPLSTSEFEEFDWLIELDDVGGTSCFKFLSLPSTSLDLSVKAS